MMSKLAQLHADSMATRSKGTTICDGCTEADGAKGWQAAYYLGCFL